MPSTATVLNRTTETHPPRRAQRPNRGRGRAASAFDTARLAIIVTGSLTMPATPARWAARGRPGWAPPTFPCARRWWNASERRHHLSRGSW